jgi:hypothetical protein
MTSAQRRCTWSQVKSNLAALGFRSSWGEIQNDSRLRFYGFCLALTHLLTAYSWWREDWPKAVSKGQLAICQPFFQSCSLLRIFPVPVISGFLFFYAGLSIVTASLFIRSSLVRPAMIAFATLTIFKLAIYAQDFLLMGNYHYMPLLVSIAFVFLPQKVRMIPVLICCFYFSAGLLKLNLEWLSGSDVFHSPITGYWLRVCSALVVWLELFFIWWILHPDRRIRFFVFGLLVLFHAYSWTIVGYFYPLTMALLLAIFPLTWYMSGRGHYTADLTATAGQRFAFPNKFCLTLFLLAQLTPYLYRGDPALTGEGRFIALNMFDARAECRSFFVARYRNGRIKEVTPSFQSVGVRVRCDPYLYYAYARSFCKSLQEDGSFIDLDWRLQNKRATSEVFESRVTLDNFCHSHTEYSLVHGNDWIKK